MSLFSLEHGETAYRADFAIYGVAVAALALLLGIDAPRRQGALLVLLAVIGVAAWSLAEYLLHRFVLHGLPPFRAWHAAHHARPTALICTPTALSATLIGALVWAPASWLGGLWCGSALTLGVTVGYLVYTVTHHATHHWRSEGRWLLQRKRWHARHHHREHAGCYGVTSSFWDRVFGSTG